MADDNALNSQATSAIIISSETRKQTTYIMKYVIIIRQAAPSFQAGSYDIFIYTLIGQQ